MILIKNIEILSIDENTIDVYECDPEQLKAKSYIKYDRKSRANQDQFIGIESVKFKRETIIGQRFKNSYGTDVVIGMSEQVQKALGLPFDYFEKMQDTITCLEYDKRNLKYNIEKLEKNLTEYKTMTFWKRLKFLLHPQ